MKSIYMRLPYFLKFLVVNLYGFLIFRKRYTKEFFRILDDYKKADRPEHQTLRLQELQTLLEEAPFYKTKYAHNFYNLPVISKQTLRTSFNELFNPRHLDSYLTTGGTTGSALKIPVSREFIYHQWAVFWKFRMIHGLGFNDWCAYFMGKNLLVKDQNKPPFWIRSYTTRQLLLSLVHLDGRTVELYLREIKKSRIHWLHGYPSVLNLFAGLIQENNLVELARSLNLSVITTSSELLLKNQKSNIEDVFGCKVRQLYGLTEGVANIFECEHSNLHIDETFSFVELLKEGHGSSFCRIVGTQYHNKAFPLIRYDTGDLVIPEKAEFRCPCGRNSRVVKEIAGRVQDYLLLSDDSKAVSADLIFNDTYNVVKAQIVQDKKGCADFYIVRSENYSTRDEEALREKILSVLGNSFRFRIIYTNSLRTTENGKERFIINEVFGNKETIHS
ncbi:MAG: hypothetical protein ACM3S2_22190 [Ignavibacteriales bacterium]